MLDPSQAEKLPADFGPDTFRDHRHGTIYRHLVASIATGEAVDLVALGDRLLKAGDLRRVGGVPYLHTCTAAVPLAASIHTYAEIVMEAAGLRAIEVAAARLLNATELDDPHRRGQVIAEVAEQLTARTGSSSRGSRRYVDIGPYLDGTYVPPEPSVGGERDDNAQLLYPGSWHTVVALTAAGKSWFACWHAIAELRRGGTVVYAHFEEHSPAGTLERIRSLAPDLTIADLRERFIWLDCSTTWRPGEFAAALPRQSALVILDGINAACSLHGWPVNEPSAIGAYRQMFVTAAAKTGAAVLSLGHPPKAKDRQGERHGFGSTAWLDEVDGAAFRLEASKKSPIRRGHRGYSALYSVKDRPGRVEAGGVLEDSREGGWYYLGAFTVDSSRLVGNTVAHLGAPERAESDSPTDVISLPTALMFQISRALQKSEQALSQNAVEALVSGRAATKRAALEFLVNDGYVARTKRGAAYLYSHTKPFASTEGEAQ